MNILQNNTKQLLEKRGHQVTMTKDGVECVDEYTNEAKYAELFRKMKKHLLLILYYLIMICQEKMVQQAAKEILEIKPNQRIIFLSAYGHGIIGSH